MTSTFNNISSYSRDVVAVVRVFFAFISQMEERNGKSNGEKNIKFMLL